MKTTPRFSTHWGRTTRWLLAVWFTVASFPALAEVRFDMFPGFGAALAHRAWNPVVFELENDGETIDATIEIQGDHGETRTRVAVELPPNTTKRLVIPLFAFQNYPTGWSATLVDEGGRKLAENRPSGLLIAPESIPLILSLPESTAGGPGFPKPTTQNGQQFQSPAIREAQVALFPDSALTLSGLDSIYLHSSRAVELEPNQVDALLTWLNSGGHLVVSVDQPQDLTGADWLGRLFPVNLGATSATGPTAEVFQSWLTSEISEDFQPFDHRLEDLRNETVDPGTPDAEFERAEFLYWPSEVRDGETLLQAEDGAPLIVRANRGRGVVTALTFSPELEPFRTWRGGSWLWTAILGVSTDWFHPSRSGNTNASNSAYNARSLDNAFGTMIDSRQVKKLPIGWLVAMLVVYLVVIGPGDYFLLKRLGRPMLTWITFPLYVAIFSGLIYYIGYRLRAGEVEWNETQVVDILPRGSVVDHHGWMFQSIYSPLNRNYELVLDDRDAGMRSEASAFGSSSSSGRLNAVREGRGFSAEAFVPVWTSRLVSGEWFQQRTPTLSGDTEQEAGIPRVRLENLGPTAFREVWVAYDEYLYSLGTLEAGASGEWALDGSLPREAIESLVGNKEAQFHQAAMRRDQALGSTAGAQVERSAANLIATSLFEYDGFREAGQRLRVRDTDGSRNQRRAHLTKLELWTSMQGNSNRYRVLPGRGYDLSRELFRGRVLVFALSDELHATPPIAKFSPARQKRETLYRMVLTAEGDGSL